MVPVLFEILSTEPRTRGVDVHYYTAELLAGIQPFWAEMEAKELIRDPNSDIVAYRDWLKRMYPAGGISHITLYVDDDTLQNPEALSTYILSQLPCSWLEIKHNCFINTPDLSKIEQMKGSPIATTLNPVTKQLNVMIPVKSIG